MSDAIRLVSDEPFARQFDSAWGDMVEVITDAILRKPVAALEAIGQRDSYFIDGADDEGILEPAEEGEDAPDITVLDDDAAHDLAVSLMEDGAWSDISGLIEAVDDAVAGEKQAEEAGQV